MSAYQLMGGLSMAEIIDWLAYYQIKDAAERRANHGTS